MSRIRSVSQMERGAKKFCEAKAQCRLVHQPKDVFGRPDFCNRARMTAVFVHGCFWHLHGHVRVPKTNRAFWTAKFAANARRHRKVVRRLRAEGWRVITVWECDVKKPTGTR